MKIRNRLTLQFTALVAVILVIVLASIFYLALEYRASSFNVRLRERAFITANVFLEEDELAKKNFETYQRKYLESLPDEVIQIYDSDNHTIFINKDSSLKFDERLISKTRREKEVIIPGDNVQTVAILYTDNQGSFVIVAAAVDRNGYARLASLGWTMSFVFIGSLLIIFVAGRIFSKKALESIPEVVKQVKSITATNLHLRVNEGNGKDEIAELAVTFNDMLQRLEATFLMQKNFVSNASHELRTPLTAIIGETEVILSKPRDIEEYKTALISVNQEMQHFKALINGLLNLAQTDNAGLKNSFESLRIDEFIGEVVREVNMKTYPAPDIHIKFTDMPEIPERLIINANKQLLTTALVNILENAIKYSENKLVICELTCAPNHLTLTVTDEGIGISPAEIDHILQPFYRAANARLFFGHGIGLSLASKILFAHQFDLKISSVLGKGTVVSISIPI
jgi:signal transduction histidine kinase